MSAHRRSSRRHSRRASVARGADRIARGGVCPWRLFVRRETVRLPQACVELLERRLAGTQLLFIQRVERGVDGAQVCVQVFRILLEVKQAGDDLPFSGMVLQKSERGGAVVQLVIGIELAQRQLGTVMLLDN